jgi:hypothetical protein
MNGKVNIMHELIELNYRFGKAEVEAEKDETKKQSYDFFERHLHEKLVFRRVGGAVVNREEFLKALASPGNRTERLSSYVIEVTESEDGRTAEVLVLVDLKGQRNGNDATGFYRNRRIFVKQQNGDWQCLVWFNTRITPVDP